MLGSEALATFGTTTGQNLASAFSGHAGTETVGALALQYAGLKSSFHGLLPVVNPGSEPAALSTRGASVGAGEDLYKRTRNSIEIVAAKQRVPGYAAYLDLGIFRALR
jgi:hypothetical protein